MSMPMSMLMRSMGMDMLPAVSPRGLRISLENVSTSPAYASVHDGRPTLFQLEGTFFLKKINPNLPGGPIVEEKDDDKSYVKENRHVKVHEQFKPQPHRRTQQEEKQGVHAFTVDDFRLFRPLQRD